MQRPFICTFLLLCVSLAVSAQKNYIPYHQQSLVVQQYMLDKDTSRALELLERIDKEYGLLPPETFAKALCLFTLGEKPEAEKAYLESLRQRVPIGWLYTAIPQFKTAMDSLWYDNLIVTCNTFWNSRPQYADGPNPGMPTVVTWANNAHQQLYESGSENDSLWAKVHRDHLALADSIAQGLIPVPSILAVGVSQEFDTFLLHSCDFWLGKESLLRKWLEDGLIWPYEYAAPFDRCALDDGRPIPYGTYDNLKPGDLLPGHEERRAAIGMGDRKLERLRFHYGS